MGLLRQVLAHTSGTSVSVLRLSAATFKDGVNRRAFERPLLILPSANERWEFVSFFPKLCIFSLNTDGELDYLDMYMHASSFGSQK